MRSEPRSTVRTKRLVVLSDGTWQTPENKIPTNILKLAIATRLESEDLTSQLVFYDAGLGTAGPIDRLRGGGLGEGIDANIQELYTFLAMNYDVGDEIYMFGFSRGSYTVRSLAGLINRSGLVKRTEIQFVKEAYDLYRSAHEGDSPEAIAFREAHGDKVPIKLLACFDTVGSLGIPFKGLGPLSEFDQRKYAFHDTELSDIIENAIHAMSIDEDRQVFAPTDMKPNKEVGPEQVTELYFAGGHGGVGGGDEYEQPLSDFVLHWMIGEMENRGLKLSIDMTQLFKTPPSPPKHLPPKQAGGSFLFQIIETVTGKFVRPISGLAQVHSSAVERYRHQSSWRPAALEPFKELLLSDADSSSDSSA